MKTRASEQQQPASKALTGVTGLDVALRGGFPTGRSTLLVGSPGAGKTVLSLQSLACAARELGEPGIFVAFEESAARVASNSARFGWNLPALQPKKLFLLDAQPHFELVKSGDADFRGLLAILDAKVEQMGARRIVFDAIDIMLYMFNDPAAERRELYRLNEWLLERELTAVITCRADRTGLASKASDFLEFMVDCAMVLEHRWSHGVSQRSLRVLKYRGSDFHENEAPFVIGPGGFDVATLHDSELPRAPVTSERISSGVSRLDDMLEGGYFRGASILITGTPGTAKTTLCGAFIEAACQRGEPSLLVSFDSDSGEIVRNLTSVGIRLDRFCSKGGRPALLRIIFARSVLGSAETQLMRIKQVAREHGARCVVIDPVSVLAHAGNSITGAGVAERLIDWAKSDGVTLLCSSLIDDSTSTGEHTQLQISTIADTWIHLNYLARGAERNRGLSILKSRGTAHSNQVRELILSRKGITLADAYSASGEVLMGTLRWEREQVEAAALIAARSAEHQERVGLLAEEEVLATRLAELKREVKAKRTRLQALARSTTARSDATDDAQSSRLKKRGADQLVPDEPPLR